MDSLLNKGKQMMSNSGSGNTAGGAQQPAQQQTGGGSEDYGDKALDFIEKKSGHTMSRDQNEKITDGARGLYEKQTGKQVNSKFSN